MQMVIDLGRWLQERARLLDILHKAKWMYLQILHAAVKEILRRMMIGAKAREGSAGVEERSG